jgi:hypothetical protein
MKEALEKIVTEVLNTWDGGYDLSDVYEVLGTILAIAEEALKGASDEH